MSDNPGIAPLPPGVPQSLGGKFAPTAVSLPRTAYSPDKRDFVEHEDLAAAAAALKQTHIIPMFPIRWVQAWSKAL